LDTAAAEVVTAEPTPAVAAINPVTAASATVFNNNQVGRRIIAPSFFLCFP
jgi:hypothetical protein